MDKNKICEALYALPDGAVEKRRKPLVIPALLLLSGVGMIVLNNMYAADLSVNLRSSVVFVGGVLAVIGFFTLLVRMLGSGGTPFYKDGKCYLRYEEIYFEHGARQQVVQYVGEGNMQRLQCLPQARVPVVAVAVYRTPDNRFTAMQAYEYADLEYRPLTDLKIVAA